MSFHTVARKVHLCYLLTFYLVVPVDLGDVLPNPITVRDHLSKDVARFLTQELGQTNGNSGQSSEVCILRKSLRFRPSRGLTSYYIGTSLYRTVRPLYPSSLIILYFTPN